MPKTQHHRVSVELCDPDGIYCAEVLGMENEFILTKNLERRILPIRKANMNDKIAEGPHAVFKNEDLRTRGGDFYWAAASCRLEQNLADIRDLSSACQLSVQKVWDSWKTIMQGDRHSKRHSRIKREDFLEKVYYCSTLFQELPGEESENEASLGKYN